MAAKKFRLETEARFELTGRGKVNWFNLLAPDESYNKLGGKFFPDNAAVLGGIIDDILAEAERDLKEEGIDATRLDPKKVDDNGNVFYNVSRSAQKANGEDAVIKLRGKNGKVDAEALGGNELGNGSVVNMKVMARAYFMPEKNEAGVKIPARFGVSIMPLEVQVIDHKIYSQDGDFSDESGGDSDDGGFSNESEVSNDDY